VPDLAVGFALQDLARKRASLNAAYTPPGYVPPPEDDDDQDPDAEFEAQHQTVSTKLTIIHVVSPMQTLLTYSRGLGLVVAAAHEPAGRHPHQHIGRSGLAQGTGEGDGQGSDRPKHVSRAVASSSVYPRLMSTVCWAPSMLDEIDSHVDRTSSRLDKAQRKMARFIEQNQSRFPNVRAWLRSCWRPHTFTCHQTR